jgi:hypothetical protein
MTPIMRPVILVAACVLRAPLNANAQQLQMPVVLRGPTVVLMVARDTTLAPDASDDDRRWHATFDSTLAQARRLADSMGYEVRVRYGPTVRIIDPKGNATYQSPRDALEGYVIVAPYSTPRFIPGVLAPSELWRAIKDYGRLIHPLQT